MFPPQFCELPAPSLDLFDLDEHFSSERVRIAQLTNKCECTVFIFCNDICMHGVVGGWVTILYMRLLYMCTL